MNAFTEGDVEKKLTVYECEHGHRELDCLHFSDVGRVCKRCRTTGGREAAAPVEYVPVAALSEAVGRAGRCPVDWRSALYDALTSVNTDSGAVVAEFEELCKDPAYHREDVSAGRLASEVEEAREALRRIVGMADAGEPDWKVRDAALDARAVLLRLDGEKAACERCGDTGEEVSYGVRPCPDCGSLRDREGGD